MFDIGWTELLVLAIVAILIVGPKDLPRMLYSLGQTLGKLRRQADDFRRQFNESMREAGMDDVRNDMQKMSDLNPARQIKNEIESTFRDEPKPAGKKSTSSQPASPEKASAPHSEAGLLPETGKPETADAPHVAPSGEQPSASGEESRGDPPPVRSTANGAADSERTATAKDAVN
jgi:sec-independent protein translocase protein TatB